MTHDRARDKRPDMVPFHSASLKRAERIASCQAENRKVVQIAFKPEWTRHKEAAPLKHNDIVLETYRSGPLSPPTRASSRTSRIKAERWRFVWRFAKGAALAPFV
jgi:hypothetical protein